MAPLFDYIHDPAGTFVAVAADHNNCVAIDDDSYNAHVVEGIDHTSSADLQYYY